MMNHTPGKWAVDLETGEITAADGQVSIGTIYGSDDFPCLDEDNDEGVRAFVAECQANARLIAAAPDLLAALIALHESCGQLIQFKDGRNSIRVACPHRGCGGSFPINETFIHVSDCPVAQAEAAIAVTKDVRP